ncbi:VanZ family protein [Patescibacteria group bacterium]
MNNKYRKFINYWLPPIIWMVVIFTFSQRQRVSVSEDYIYNFIFFKVLHLIEYGFLMFLNYRAIRNTLKISDSKGLWYGFLLTFIYAVTDEFHQSLVPTREATVRDVIIDGLGAYLSWILIKNILPIAPKKLKNLAKNLQII